MLEYSYEEAIEVLEKSLGNAKERLVGFRLKRISDSVERSTRSFAISHTPPTATTTAHDQRGPDAPAEPDHHGGGEHGKALQLERAEQEEARGGSSRGHAQVPRGVDVNNNNNKMCMHI